MHFEEDGTKRRKIVMPKRSIIVNGYAYPSIDTEVLKLWLQDLTFLSTFSYGITKEGGVIDLKDEKLIKSANGNGVKALMVLTPMDANGKFNDEIASVLLENPAARTNLIKNILDTIKKKGLYGVDFDFEYIPEKNRDEYVALVNEARETLNPMGYIVTVALAPKTSADQIGVLYQGHDYVGMGKAANLVLLMTYEWGYTYGPPMAVAPINAVRRVLDYGVSEIPPEKILMGMPNYGYDWTLPFVQGKSKAKKVSHMKAVELAKEYGVPIEFDKEAQTPFFNYVDKDGKEHVVWFENEESIRAKLALVEEYGFAGVSYWNIMDYSPINSRVLQEMYTVIKI